MIRTLIFGAIAAYVGKKLYDDGTLQSFKDDAVNRFNQVKSDIADKSSDPTASSPSASPAVSTAY